MNAGLCSVTFRALDAGAVVDLAAQHRLAVEWGGDVHLPPGDLAAAERLAARCAAAGVVSRSYGSYLQAGRSTADDADAALDTAQALGAPHVRVWCPYGVGPSADEATRGGIVAGLAGIAAAAAERGLDVSVEFHDHTLTATAASANRLLAEVGAPNLFTYWQPVAGLVPAQWHAELDAVAANLSHLHVFRWRPDGHRLPLADGVDLWPHALRAVRASGGRWTHWRVAFLEFVADDDPTQLAADVATLKSWLA